MTRLFSIFLTLIVLVCATPAYALKITPFKASITPDVAGATQVFRIENNSAEPAAVQISIETWHIQPDGTEINTDAEDDFTIFPAQIVMKPRETKSVRVQWLGDPAIQSEKAYRLIAEQVPVNLKDTPAGSAVRFLLRFRAALYITPVGAQSDITVRDVKTGADTLRLMLENTGNRHVILNTPTLHLTLQGDRNLDIAGAALGPLNGENLHAGATRFFDVPRTADVTGHIVSARLSFENGF